MAFEREVGGIRCFEVLGLLSEYLDGQLDDARRARVEAHVQGCDVCARFGGEFSEAVRLLRQRLAAPPVDTGMAQRLRARLRREGIAIPHDRRA